MENPRYRAQFLKLIADVPEVLECHHVTGEFDYLIKVRCATTDDLDRWRAFHEAVHRLPAEEREVFMLTFYHGWTQPEIATLFQVDERTIRRRWQAASVRLAEILGGTLPS